ncbi:ABC transporter permease [Methanocella conradii]|uniref:ABC transporter permease n=1 Tax=Methanocella conradii TaxID=1175444 RepID=UPI00157CB54B|nr:ABC transporter permease [Methanocella conradii]
MMGGVYAIIRKEIASVMKEKTMALAILIQLLIAAFSSVILVGLVSFYDPASIGQNTNMHFNVGVAGDHDGALTSCLRGAGFTVTPFTSADDALSSMRAGSLDAVMAMPDGESTVVDVRLYLPPSDSKSTVITMAMQGPLKKYENYLREKNGVHVKYTQMAGRDSTTYEFLYSFIVPLLMFFPAFIAGSMIIDSISEEIENKTLDTLLSTPVSLNEVLFGKAAAAVLLAVIQCIMWLLLLSMNRLYVKNAVLVLFLAFIISAFVTFGSALISMYFKDRERSQFTYSILLMTAAGGGLAVNPSPINLLTRLAMGDPHAGILDVSLYLLPLVVLVLAFYLASKRLLAYRA